MEIGYIFSMFSSNEEKSPNGFFLAKSMGAVVVGFSY
jgi:hypothetical protein